MRTRDGKNRTWIVAPLLAGVLLGCGDGDGEQTGPTAPEQSTPTDQSQSNERPPETPSGQVLNDEYYSFQSVQQGRLVAVATEECNPSPSHLMGPDVVVLPCEVSDSAMLIDKANGDVSVIDLLPADADVPDRTRAQVLRATEQGLFVSYDGTIPGSGITADKEFAALGLVSYEGDLRWLSDGHYDLSGYGQADPTIFYERYEQSLFAVELATGERRWETSIAETVWAKQALPDPQETADGRDGFLSVADIDDFAIDPDSGAVSIGPVELAPVEPEYEFRVGGNPVLESHRMYRGGDPKPVWESEVPIRTAFTGKTRVWLGIHEEDRIVVADVQTGEVLEDFTTEGECGSMVAAITTPDGADALLCSVPHGPPHMAVLRT